MTNLLKALLLIATLAAGNEASALCYAPKQPELTPLATLKTVETDNLNDHPPSPDVIGVGLGLDLRWFAWNADEVNDQKKLGADGGVIYYYEPGPDGKDRLCRTEKWEKYNPDRDPEYLRTKNEWQKPRHARTPRTIELFRQGYFVDDIKNYRYDESNRLAEVVNPRYSMFGAEYRPSFNSICYAYDKEGRLTFYASTYKSPTCAGAQEKASSYQRFIYARPHEPFLARQIKGGRHDDGSWSETIIGFGLHGSPGFEAEVDSKNGLTRLSTGITYPDGFDWDVAQRNQANRFTKYAIYYFPLPGPVELLDDLTKVSKYDRVRVGYVPGGRADQINEVITAKGEVLVRHYADDNTHRQDIMKDGKLVRVLISNGMAHIGNKNSILYYEDPAPLMAFAAKHGTTPNKVNARVYDVSPDGKWTLIAGAWWSDPPPPKKRRWPFGKKPAMVFGKAGVETVDGQHKWGDDEQAMLRSYGMTKSMPLAQKFGRPDPTY